MFSPNGRFLAVATENRLIQLWDPARVRQQLAALNLDWDLPPYPPWDNGIPPPPLRMAVMSEQEIPVP